MATKPLKFQMTLYPDDVAAIAALGDALEAANVDVRGPSGARSVAAVVRAALRIVDEQMHGTEGQAKGDKGGK